MTEKVYEIPESQLFRLLEVCSKANGCKHFGDEGCQCSGNIAKVKEEPVVEAPKATAKQRNKKAK
jgi:hypothetical protein